MALWRLKQRILMIIMVTSERMATVISQIGNLKTIRSNSLMSPANSTVRWARKMPTAGVSSQTTFWIVVRSGKISFLVGLSSLVKIG